MKKILQFFLFLSVFFCTTGCNSPSKPVKTNPPKDYLAEFEASLKNDTVASTRAANLDFIFNNKTLGTTTITIKRSEWNKLCDDYRYFYKNENCVHALNYRYEKDGETWSIPNVGFRLRGNTSRFCPQGIDNGRQQDQLNQNWSQEYYDYAEKPNNDYRQTHFKVDFEEFLEGEDEMKMANCMKGVALKRLDSACGREIFCFDLFHRYGIWTAPRASHTRLILEFIEDETNYATTKIDYGVYEMFEEVNKQSLKAREKSENNPNENAWNNNKGNLWKCQHELVNYDYLQWNIGVEDIRIFYKDETPAGENVTYKQDPKGERIAYVFDNYPLDLKTNKEDLDSAKKELMSFIEELNSMSTKETAQIKAFYEKWFDVDFFLKTVAITVICGMDDDYWGNNNNFYLYFDTGKKGSGKVYYIPFDYDNSLGGSVFDGGFKQNPLDWGRGKNRPLIDNILKVPEFNAKYIKYLKELSAKDSEWNYTRCSQQFLYWQNLLRPYIDSPDIDYHISVKGFWYGTWQPDGYSLVDFPNNLYDATRESLNSWLLGQ
ncbi:MAG: CotH kinase family protein [Treponema sp.]|nr:CotH kinase family protein [Treponema sp.]